MQDKTTPVDRAAEAAAEQLWHHFASSHAVKWKDEPHAAEYRLAARAVVATFLRELPKQLPASDFEETDGIAWRSSSSIVAALEGACHVG